MNTCESPFLFGVFRSFNYRLSFSYCIVLYIFYILTTNEPFCCQILPGRQPYKRSCSPCLAWGSWGLCSCRLWTPPCQAGTVFSLCPQEAARVFASNCPHFSPKVIVISGVIWRTNVFVLFVCSCHSIRLENFLSFFFHKFAYIHSQSVW
jgi:hypothetical protein